MQFVRVALIFAFLFTPFFLSAVDEPKTLLGFTNEQAANQFSLESKFDSYLKASNLHEWMERLSARPHHIGSPYGKENAEFMAGLFRSWGYETQIEEFKVLFPTPKTRVLEMIAPQSYVAQLQEPEIKEDRTSGQKDEQLPTYNAFSVDGDVTAELVYVNYGVPKDYEELDLRGIDVKGKIVIARYGQSWRGIKPKVAAEHGAVGCIIFSDPSGDGFLYGDVYPKGGWRNENSVQRGSVMDFTEHDGDPLTPFIPAVENAKRLKREEANAITKIPVLPISYKDALPLLSAMEGPIAPETWQGKLAIPYKLGPGPTRVHLKLEFNWNLVPAYDVVAKMKGSVYPDQWIVRGNHHDAWVNGATDPISGMVALLEEARAVSELAKTGWKPKRTLVYAGWDGEEPGLLGSTEWVEMHREELQKKAVAYINSDSNSRGFLDIIGSQSLERFINQVARDVQDPEKQISVLDRIKASIILNGDEKQRTEVRQREDVRLPAAGSGSDFTPFLQHAGIASLNIGYGGEEEYGQYHSIYDSFDHYLRFMDPKFDFGVALAKTGGRCVLRLSEADLLPFEFTGFTDNISVYLKELQDLTEQLRQETIERNKRIDDKTYESYFDPQKTYVVPKRYEDVPHLNFSPMQNAISRLEKSSQDLKNAIKKAMEEGSIQPETRNQLNAILYQSEHSLTRKEGLPGRPWFTHQIYAPGVYTGYAAKSLPSVREAIEQRKWKLADEQILTVSQTLESYSSEIERAIALLKSGK